MINPAPPVPCLADLVTFGRQLGYTCWDEGGCGNCIVDPGEECDDGNTSPGDGCSATCTLE